MRCFHCGQHVSDSHRICVICGHDLGFPNVRAASAREERDALDTRYDAAVEDSRQRTCEDVIDAFEMAVRQTRAVFCRSWAVAHGLLSSEQELFATFHQSVRAEVRLPSSSAFDIIRVGIDAALFPHYYEQIRFAALSLDGRGPESYGACSIVLRESTIAHRASVFEENSIVFYRRHQLETGSPPSPGYRATWADRGRLAVAKLHARLAPRMHADQFPRVVLEQRGGTDADDFIEVHIYGPLHLRSIERVVGATPTDPDDEVLLRRIRRTLEGVGACVDLY